MKKALLSASVVGGFVLICFAGCETGESLESDSIDDDSTDLSDLLDSSVRDGAVGPGIVYQAESYTAQSGCNLATVHAGYTGTGFMDYGGNGTYIEWNSVNAAAAGTYQLLLRYANGSGGARQSAILINGVSIGNVAFAPTGGWPNWGTVAISASLITGPNTIRVLANTGSGGPNLDSLEVAPLDLCPSDPNKTTPGICGCGKPEGTCTLGASGLNGTYFDNVDFTGPKLERVDSTLDFNWGNGSPDPQIGNDTFSAQWIGFVEAQFSETYTFYAVSDDGIRVSVNNQVVIDDWSIHAPREASGTISLLAGRRYEIEVEYFENGGGAVARLLWSSASQAKQVIPQKQLFTQPKDDGNRECVEVAENKIAALSCPNGLPIVRIDFASYGLPIGSCPNGFTSGTCHAVSSLEKIKASCLNKASCSVAASNSVFGDPCSGKPKKLAVVYSCGGSVDACPTDPDKTSPGICGCGVADTDLDKDGTADCKDGCPNDPSKTSPGECGCGAAEGTCNPSTAQIDAVFFAQTHVQQPDHPYLALVANRPALIKAHIVAPAQPKAPLVRAILTLNGKTLVLLLTGPAVLPASIAKDPGIAQHSYDDSFTGFIPKDWMKPGLAVAVEAGARRVEFTNLKIGAPTKVTMTMFDVQYFSDTNSDYPSGWKEELEAKWPVSELEVRRLPHVVFEELVVPPRAGVAAARVSSKDDYKVQTGLAFDGEQAAALQWSGALKAAAGTAGRHTLYYINIYGAWAGGQAGGFAGVGNGTSVGILNHELGHALGLGDCYGNDANYPYKGAMYGIPAPQSDLHVGPTWAYYLYDQAFIPPTVQPNSVGGTLGTFKRDPMCGGGQGDQEKGYLMRHFSDYSVWKMRSYLEAHVVVWNANLASYASWDASTSDYTKKVSNNGVQYPLTRDAAVVSLMAAVSGANQDVNMVYPPIGPYTAGLIKLFDPRNATQRQEAGSIFCPSTGCDVSLRITQGGVQKIYMLAASLITTADPLAGNSLLTKAINLPAADGEVTKAELLMTPDAEINGLPSNPTVLYSWSH